MADNIIDLNEIFATIEHLDDEASLKKIINKAECIINTAYEQININKRNRSMEALHEIFEGLQKLADNGEGQLILCYEDATVEDIAHYLMDKYNF